MTFQRQRKNGGWRRIGTDDNRPYRVFDDVSGLDAGTKLRYRAVVLDNAGNTRRSGERASKVAAPTITLEAPAAGGKLRGKPEVRAVTAPDHSWYTVTIQRRVGTGGWTTIGRDDSSPVYTAFDDLAGLEPGTALSYRAILDHGNGTVTSAVRSAEVAPAPIDTAVIHYGREDEDYDDWGVHLFGDAIADGVATDWTAPRMPTRFDGYGAVFEIPLKDDTKAVGFIVHKPGGDDVPTTREPGGDRSFVPVDHPEIWLVGGRPGACTSRSRSLRAVTHAARVIVVSSINVDLVVSLERLPARRRDGDGRALHPARRRQGRQPGDGRRAAGRRGGDGRRGR